MVAETLQHFDGERFHLLAWCVMPNHVHVVLQPFAEFELAQIMHTWKTHSARLAATLDRQVNLHAGVIA